MSISDTARLHQIEGEFSAALDLFGRDPEAAFAKQSLLRREKIEIKHRLDKQTGNKVQLTYRELADRLGVSPDGARMKAKRAAQAGRWRIIKGNHPCDPVLVEMDASDLPTAKTIRVTSYQVGGTHYADHNIEPFQVIADWCGDEGFAAYLRGNCIKYLCRYQDKNGVEDLRKCQHYLAELINLEINMAANGGRNG